MNIKEYDKILNECRQIAIKKNHDYGDESLKLFNGLSIFIRMYDKMERLKNSFEKKLKVDDEKIEDTLQDLINYSTYLIMIRRGKLE